MIIKFFSRYSKRKCVKNACPIRSSSHCERVTWILRERRSFCICCWFRNDERLLDWFRFDDEDNCLLSTNDVIDFVDESLPRPESTANDFETALKEWKMKDTLDCSLQHTIHEYWIKIQFNSFMEHDTATCIVSKNCPHAFKSIQVEKIGNKIMCDRHTL